MKIEVWWLWSQAVLKKCFGHYSRPLNWRNELCCWSPWSLYSVTAGHLSGLDQQGVGEGSGSWDGVGLKDLGCLRESLLVVLPPSLSYPAHCFAPSLFLATVFDLHLAARTRRWEEVIQHVPLKLPRPDWECHVSRRQIIPPGEAQLCGIYLLAMKLTLMIVSNHQDYLFMK